MCRFVSNIHKMEGRPANIREIPLLIPKARNISEAFLYPQSDF